MSKPARATFTITEAWSHNSRPYPDGADEKILKGISAYQDYVPLRTSSSVVVDAKVETIADPLKQIEFGVARLHSDVAADFLKRLREQHPNFLEQSTVSNGRPIRPS